MYSLIIKKCIVGTLHSISSITEIEDFLSHLSRSVSLAAVLINFLRRWLENLKYRPLDDASPIAFLMIRLSLQCKVEV